MENTVKLTTAVKSGSDTIEELTFRPPTIAEIRKLGYPMMFRGDDTMVNTEVAAKYASILSGEPPSVINKLSIPDFTMVLGKVCSFFGA